MQVCSRCKDTKYCNSDCQKSHWKEHKKECRPRHERLAQEDDEKWKFWVKEGIACEICFSFGANTEYTTTTLSCGHRFHSACVRAMQEFGVELEHVCLTCRKRSASSKSEDPTKLLIENSIRVYVPHRRLPDEKQVLDVIDEMTKLLKTNESSSNSTGNNNNGRYSLYGPNYIIGDYLRQKNDNIGAEAAFQRALSINPDNGYVHFTLAVLATQIRNDISTSEFHYRKAVSLNPEVLVAHTQLARILGDRGDLPAAEQAVREALKVDANNKEAHILLGRLLMDQDKKSEAEKEFRIAIKQNEFTAEPHFELGRLLYLMSREAKLNKKERKALLLETERELRRCLRLVKADDKSIEIDSHRILGLVYSNLNELETTVAEFRTVVQLAPDSIKDRLYLASIYRMIDGCNDDAEKELNYILRVDPTCEEAATSLKELKMKMKLMKELSSINTRN